MADANTVRDEDSAAGGSAPIDVIELINSGNLEDDEVVFVESTLLTSNMRTKRKRKRRNIIVVPDFVYDLTSPCAPPVAPIRDGSIESKRIAMKCAVCLEDELNSPMSTLCGHIFCSVCIINSIESTGKCPVCACKLNKKKIHRIYI